MRKAIYLLLVIAVVASCSRLSSQYDQELDRAERLMRSNADSALSMLDAIDPSELEVDSLRAKYHFLKAYGHMKRNRSMIGDSLISFAHNHYRGKDIAKDIRSGMALAWYRFWVGDTPGAISMLDSIAGLPHVPDSLMTEALRIRVLLGTSEYQGRQIIPLAKRLHILENDTLRKMEAKYMLLAGYEYAGEIDSALYLVNELIDYARSRHWGDKQFLFMIEQAQLLTEAGHDGESDRLIGEIFSKAGPDNGAADVLHFQYAINALNTGDVQRAAHHLAIADSLAVKLRGDDDAYFRSYSNLLHAMIDFRQTGRIKLMHINGLNNRQSERFNRMKASQWESERGALHQQNRALKLKAESEHKTVVILIVSLVGLLILAVSSWVIIRRRQRERDNEERIEALQKMVAETPTEQNREMLRKISSIGGDTNGELVDWQQVFEMIDNLYSGFYGRLHAKYGDLLTLKEEQIIVLMAAGFSTKEISVITGQTTSTIYVRKSSIRKNLAMPEKEDIIHFLSGLRAD